MQSEDLRAVDGAAAGAWIRPRLGGEFGAVTLQVPTGFDAYARIFHRASDQEGRPVRWGDVAAAMGTTAHREMQWYALIRSPDPCVYDDSRWPGNGPMTGELDDPQLEALCEILAVHSGEPENCLFGLCTIMAWVCYIVPPAEREPLLKLPDGRDHVVLQGPLKAVDQIGFRGAGGGTTLFATAVAPGADPPKEIEPAEWFTGMSPNLIWPPENSWLVASEVDFDSTLVGGDRGLIEAILDAPELEAWAVEPDDSLACDADKVNAASKERG